MSECKVWLSTFHTINFYFYEHAFEMREDDDFFWVLESNDLFRDHFCVYYGRESE